MLPVMSNNFFCDSLTNALTGAGTSIARPTQGFYQLGHLMGPQEIDAAYRTSWIARKIVDIPAKDMTRAGWDLQGDKSEIERMEKMCEQFDLIQLINKALRYGRLGGGVILLGLPGDVSSPAPENGKLSYMHTMSRWQTPIGPLVRDLTSPYFGQPEYYSITGQSGAIKVHPSRVLAFKGNPIADCGFADETYAFWGDCVLQSCHDAVRNADSAQSEIAALISESKVDVFKFADLIENAATKEGEARIRSRTALVNSSKSIHRAVILDSTDEWEQRQITWPGMPEVMNAFLSFVAGASDIPATRLLGKSPDGMNATGESDLQNYYQHISSEQESHIRPALRTIFRHMGFPDADFTFAPLKVASEKEIADIAKVKADTSKVYYDMGILPESEFAKAVANQLIEDGTYPGLDDSLTEMGEEWAEQMREESIARAEVVSEQVTAPVTDSVPMPLYVRRDLINIDEVAEWAQSQGLTLNDNPHVTITYSRNPVDWIAIGNSWDEDITIPAGGPRVIERFGGAVVLLFSSWAIISRHESMRHCGASFDYVEYQPHVTIEYNNTETDIASIEPYRGKLVFGPEIFEPINSDYGNE